MKRRFLNELELAHNIFIAGGGGSDMFCGLPWYRWRKRMDTENR
jgi:hypothetical protein